MDQTRHPHVQTEIAHTLVVAATAGDRSALREIYEKTCDRVYRLMVRMAGKQDAEDLTQQVYLRVFEKLGQFQGSAKFETWLYRIAANEALQHLRRERVRKTVPIEVEPAIGDERSADQQELADRLNEALGQIEPQLRAMISMKEDGGLSYQQIADALGIPAGTVGSRLNRARRELARLLEEVDG